MQAHDLNLHTPLAPGLGSKVQKVFFLKVVMLHIKLKGMERRAACKYIVCPYKHLPPVGLGQNVIFF